MRYWKPTKMAKRLTIPNIDVAMDQLGWSCITGNNMCRYEFNLYLNQMTQQFYPCFCLYPGK